MWILPRVLVLTVTFCLLAGVTAVVVGASSSPKKPAAATSTLRLGVVAGVHHVAAYENPGPLLDRLRAGGVRSIREQFKWSLIEPEQGRFRWERYDRLLRATARRGIEVVPLLFENPHWAARRWNEMPSPTRYARFARAVVARYGPNGRFWKQNPRLPRSGAPRWFELLNEPYEPAFSAGKPDPRRYARLVATAGAAIHRTDKRARVLMAVTHKRYDGVPWIDAMHRAVPGLRRHYDGIAQHPYGYAQDLADPDNWFTRDMTQVRERMIAHGGRSKPSFITEIGWATCEGDDERCMSEETAAARLTETVRLLRTRYPWVRSVHVYGFADAVRDTPSQDSEDNYGLVRRDGTAKPGWHAFARAARGR
jgi:hypothetical protein